MAFSAVFFRDNFRPEVAIEFVFGVAADYANVDICVKFGDSRSKTVLEIYDWLTL